MLEQLYSAPPILGLVGLAIAFFIYTVMSRREIPDGEVQKIGEQIHLGAMVFMKREYTYLLIFAAVLLGLILVSDLGNDTALSFVVGASSSALAGGWACTLPPKQTFERLSQRTTKVHRAHSL